MTLVRLLLVRHAPSADTRRAAFPATSGSRAGDEGEPLDSAGRVAAAELAAYLPTADVTLSSWARRCRETAAAAGCDPALDGDLAECNFGAWAGMTPPELGEDAELTQWYADPDAAPHGGEGFANVRRRAAAVLERAAAAGGTTVAFTHGGFVKAAVVQILGLPAAAVWQIDVAPASITELHRTLDRWRLTRLNWTPAARFPVADVA